MSDVDAAEKPWPPRSVSWTWLAVLLVAYTSSLIDRQILSLMVDEIRGDLNLSDTQFGLLQGLSFALLYSTFGLMIGGLVDSAPRRVIISVGCFLWTLATMACGIANNYLQLFAARVGVGFGEAALSPAAFSALADLYPKKTLSRAVSIYIMGTGCGAGLAFMLGGAAIEFAHQIAPTTLPFIGEIRPWQLVFFIVASPGLLIAAAVRLLPEPERRGVLADRPPKWSEVIQFLKTNASVMVPFLLGISCVAGVTNASLLWGPAVMMRVYEQTAQETGFVFGIVAIVTVCSGLAVGVWLNEFLQKRGVQNATILVCVSGGLLVIPAAIGLIATNSAVTQASFGAALFFSYLPAGIALATLQTVTPNAMRGRVSAMYMFLATIVSIAIGPVIVGLLSDNIFGSGSDFRFAVAITVAGFGALTALNFWLSMKPLARLQASQAA